MACAVLLPVTVAEQGWATSLGAALFGARAGLRIKVFCCKFAACNSVCQEILLSSDKRFCFLTEYILLLLRFVIPHTSSFLWRPLLSRPLRVGCSRG